MAPHHRVKTRRGRAARERQLRVEREQREHVVMIGSLLRARPAVADAAEAVAPLLPTAHLHREAARPRREVPEQPVREDAARRVGVLELDGEAPGPGRDTAPAERRGTLLPRTREARRNRRAGSE